MMMAEKTLEQMVEERKKEAKSKKLLEKVMVVYMGASYWRAKGENKLDSYYSSETGFLTVDGLRMRYINNSYERGKYAILEISDEPTRKWLFSKKSWKRVYEESEKGGVAAYIPGSWEDSLSKLEAYVTSEEMKRNEAEKLQKQKEYENNLKSRFGL